MKRLKIITEPNELEKFINRNDIEVLNFDIKTVEQNSFAQHYFVAVVMYKELNSTLEGEQETLGTGNTLQKVEKIISLMKELNIEIRFYGHRTVLYDGIMEYDLEALESDETISEMPPSRDFKLTSLKAL